MSMSGVGSAVKNYVVYFSDKVTAPLKYAENITKLTTPIFNAFVHLGKYESLTNLAKYSGTLKESFNFPSLVDLFFSILNVSGKCTGIDRFAKFLLFFGKSMQCYNAVVANQLIDNFITISGKASDGMGKLGIFSWVRQENNWIATEGTLMITGLSFLTLGKFVEIKKSEVKAKKFGGYEALGVTHNIAKISVIATRKFGLFSKELLNKAVWSHSLGILTGLIGISKDIWEIHRSVSPIASFFIKWCMDPQLKTHEWIAIALFAFLLIMTGSITYFNSIPFQPQPEQKIPETIQIIIKGAVENPQTLEIPSGISIKEIISKISLKPDADLSKIKLSKKLHKSQTITIPSSSIEVNVQGAVKDPGMLTIPKGTQLNQLNEYITLSESADKKKLNKKRKLKDQEVIKVPYISDSKKTKKIF